MPDPAQDFSDLATQAQPGQTLAYVPKPGGGYAIAPAKPGVGGGFTLAPDKPANDFSDLAAPTNSSAHLNPVADFAGAMTGAFDKLKADYQTARTNSDNRLAAAGKGDFGSPLNLLNPMANGGSDTLRLVGDVGGLIASPVGGAVRGLVTHPAAAGLAYIPSIDPKNNFQPTTYDQREAGWERNIGTDLSAVPAGRGALAGAAVRPAVAAGGRNVLADYAAAQVDPMLSVAGPKSAQMLGQQLAGNAFVGGPLRAGAAKTANQLQAAVERQAGNMGGASTTFQSGQALKEGVDAGVGKLKAKASAQYDALKPLEQDPTPQPLTNSRAALDEAFAGFTTPALKDWLASKATDLAGIRDVVAKAPGASYAEMKAMRGVVGGMMDDPALISTGQNARLKQLYGAMTQDMQAAAEAKGLGGQLKAADANYAQLKANQKAVFNRFFGPNITEQQAYERMAQMAQTTGAKSSWPQLRTLRQAVGPEAWGEVASGMLRSMGRVTSADGESFSASQFATAWKNMSPQARQIMFGGDPENMKALDAISRIAADQQAAAKFYNHSQSGNVIQNSAEVGVHGVAAMAAWHGNFGPAVGVAALDAVGLGAAKLLSSPGFAKLVLRANQAKSPGALAAVQQQIVKFGQANPALAAEAQRYSVALKAGGQIAGDTSLSRAPGPTGQQEPR